jgi:hypothetical protein
VSDYSSEEVKARVRQQAGNPRSKGVVMKKRESRGGLEHFASSESEICVLALMFFGQVTVSALSLTTSHELGYISW